MTTPPSVIRALVVDDSAFMRRAMSHLLQQSGEVEVIGTAENGQDAIAQAIRLKPDLITLDLEMPVLDGLSALPRLKEVCDAAVLVVSSLTQPGSHAALAALQRGAVDVIAKDFSQVSLDVGRIEQDLIAKLRLIVLQRRVSGGRALPTVRRGPTVTGLTLSPANLDVVLIGSSTGGPPLVEQLVCALGENFPLPMVVAQHMPPTFTQAMAERLDQMAQVKVVHGEHGLPLLPGHVYIGRGGQHARVRRVVGKLKLEISPKPTEALYKPSVDELFRSAAEACGARTLAFILTGIGNDGLEGARPLKTAGGTILAQNHETCVVYGMPKSVIEAGLSNAEGTPTEFAALLRRMSAMRAPASDAKSTANHRQ